MKDGIGDQCGRKHTLAFLSSVKLLHFILLPCGTLYVDDYSIFPFFLLTLCNFSGVPWTFFWEWPLKSLFTEKNFNCHYIWLDEGLLSKINTLSLESCSSILNYLLSWCWSLCPLILTRQKKKKIKQSWNLAPISSRMQPWSWCVIQGVMWL